MIILWQHGCSGETFKRMMLPLLFEFGTGMSPTDGNVTTCEFVTTQGFYWGPGVSYVCSCYRVGKVCQIFFFDESDWPLLDLLFRGRHIWVTKPQSQMHVFFGTMFVPIMPATSSKVGSLQRTGWWFGSTWWNLSNSEYLPQCSTTSQPFPT